MRALFDRYPNLATAIPHVDLGVTETPVERWDVSGASLLIKRDDLTARTLGGNKVRALEFLLADLERSDRVLTVGAEGSTHALATALYAEQLGKPCDVITWPQEHNAVSRDTAERLGSVAQVTTSRSPVDAYLRAGLRRLRGRSLWVPAGGSSAHGALGHVSAALELVAQLRRDTLTPKQIVLPLGSGGSAAGLVVGLSLAELSLGVLGVRVVPRIVGNRGHVLRLARKTHSLIARHAGESIPALNTKPLDIHHDALGGAYGRETQSGTRAARLLANAGGPRLDATYSAKAFDVARARAEHEPDTDILFWLTFDSRWLQR